MISKAKEFFQEKIGDEKHLIHCQAVIDCCLGMIKNTDLNPDVFVIAGWIHDMGKLVDKKNHHIESIKFLDEFLDLNSEFLSLRSDIYDCILNHRSLGEPKTLYGEIFKVADKVALRNSKWIEWKNGQK